MLRTTECYSPILRLDLEAIEEPTESSPAARQMKRSRPGVLEDAARDADVIRLHERPDGQEMAYLLIFLEEWEWARQGMI
jgi:hypothetical protein